jgi:hypothetical protein
MAHALDNRAALRARMGKHPVPGFLNNPEWTQTRKQREDVQLRNAIAEQRQFEADYRANKRRNFWRSVWVAVIGALFLSAVPAFVFAVALAVRG